MTLYEFKILNLSDQAETVWNIGVLLGHRVENQYNLILYRIDNFFAEIRYDRDMNEVLRINSFVSDAPLQPYLDEINIDELLDLGCR